MPSIVSINCGWKRLIKGPVHKKKSMRRLPRTGEWKESQVLAYDNDSLET